MSLWVYEKIERERKQQTRSQPFPEDVLSALLNDLSNVYASIQKGDIKELHDDLIKVAVTTNRWIDNLSDIQFDPKSFPENFYSKINFTETCWLWNAGKVPSGYGKYRLGYAHRFSWSFLNGEIPENYFVLHKCDVPSCVNPNHLFIGTHQDNMDDMVAKGRNFTNRGEMNVNLKLTRKDAEEIRRLYMPKGNGFKNDFSVYGLAKKYGVSSTVVKNIITNKTWS